MGWNLKPRYLLRYSPVPRKLSSENNERTPPGNGSERRRCPRFSPPVSAQSSGCASSTYGNNRPQRRAAVQGLAHLLGLEGDELGQATTSRREPDVSGVAVEVWPPKPAAVHRGRMIKEPLLVVDGDSGGVGHDLALGLRPPTRGNAGARRGQRLSDQRARDRARVTAVIRRAHPGICERGSRVVRPLLPNHSGSHRTVARSQTSRRAMLGNGR